MEISGPPVTIVEDTGTVVVGSATILNFVGAIVTTTAPGEVTINVTSAGGANTALSNLVAPAINTNLVFGVGIAGSVETLDNGAGAATDLTLKAGNSTGVGGGNLLLSPGTGLTPGAIKLNDLSGAITAGQIWTATAGDGSGHWQDVPAATPPQFFYLTSGAGNFTVPAGATALIVTCIGGGGSGGATGTTTGPNGNAGQNTTFDTLTAFGGNGGNGGTVGGAGGDGGSSAGGDLNLIGSSGCPAGTFSASDTSVGGNGAPGYQGQGSGKGGYGGAPFTGGTNANQNTGAGGGGASGGAGFFGAGGGGGGGYVTRRIAAPVGPYAFSVGNGGAAVDGTGASHAPGGPGASGLIIIEVVF